jgi:phosphoglycolate phosphatase-like HAD superfamily hydrolase
MRIKNLGLTKYFSGLAGWEDPQIPQGMKVRNYSSKIKRFWNLKSNELKPNSFVFRQIMEHYQVGPDQLFVVGDSLHSDIKPALEIGAVGIWAKYGKECDKLSNETLSKITPWDANMIADIEFSAPVVPTFTIDQFMEIENIVPAPQETLPGF